MNPTAITSVEPSALAKPQDDTDFAAASAKLLKGLVTQNGWVRKFGNGQSEHLQYEAWQTLGKYYGYTVKTKEANYVEYGGFHGFEAKAVVIDNKTGIEIGGAEAACLNDEPNWKTKPLFQLKSMAQTRAGSKALRQILGFVVALAGYNPTPAEEMDGVFQHPAQATKEVVARRDAAIEGKIEDEQPTQPDNSDFDDSLCEDCLAEDKETVVTEKVKEFSKEKFGKTVCFKHQKAYS